jgi:hypothetical protein
MGFARAVRALRESGVEPELEANVGKLATHLGLLGDAARLFLHSERYDLLSKLYQVRGRIHSRCQQLR